MKGAILTLNAIAASWWDWIVVSTGQGLLLFAVVSVMLHFWKSLRPGLRYGLLLVVLLKLAVPPPFGATYGFSDLLSRTLSQYMTPDAVEDVQFESVAAEEWNRWLGKEPVRVFTSEDFVLTPFAWLSLLQIAGTLFVLNLIEREWRASKQVLRQSTEDVGPLQDSFQNAARAMKLRRIPRLYVSPTVNAPQTGGIIHPFVVLPSWAVAMTKEEMEILLAHELAHVRRMDALVNRVQALVQALFWWNPAVWWLNYRIREEREFCCDDLVLARGIASGLDYSRTLLNVAEHVSTPKAGWSMAGMADNFGALDRRVRRVLAVGEQQRGAGGYRALAVLFLLACWILPGATDGAEISKRVFNPEWAKKIESAFKISNMRSDRVGINEDGVPMRSGNISFTFGSHDAGTMEFKVTASGEFLYPQETDQLDLCEMRGNIRVEYPSDSVEASRVSFSSTGGVFVGDGTYKSDGRHLENSAIHIQLPSMLITTTVVTRTESRRIPGVGEVWNRFLDLFLY